MDSPSHQIQNPKCLSGGFAVVYVNTPVPENTICLDDCASAPGAINSSTAMAVETQVLVKMLLFIVSLLLHITFSNSQLTSVTEVAAKSP